MGHTHYNEIANDGGTIFAATRSTGQIEEGPVGYSLVTLHDGVVSWRFKPLAGPFPFVMITTPAEGRLLRNAEQALTSGRIVDVAAIIFGRDEIGAVDVRFEGQPWTPMERWQGVWSAGIRAPEQPAPLTVRAVCGERSTAHTITPALAPFDPPRRIRSGSDAASIGEWHENGVLGTQLGPNRNGRKW